MIAALVLLLGGCADGTIHPVDGTTFRVQDPTIEQTKGLSVYPFVDQSKCSGAKILPEKDPYHECLPFVDRATGQVRIAFQPRIGAEPWPMALQKASVKVLFNHTPPADFEFIPHDPQPTNQIFILLIDTSGSMQMSDVEGGPTRLEKVRAALTQPDVVDSFFPPDASTDVVPLMFRDKPTPIVIGDKPLVSNRADYIRAIRDGLDAGRGYTPLYSALSDVLKNTLTSKVVFDEIQLGRQPTIIALTDGFNNVSPSDTCASNVAPLNALLADIRSIRQNVDMIAHRPAIFTVGLGRARWPHATPQDTDDISVTQLCGNYKDYLIDGGLDAKGVDNRALAFIAHAADGNSYIRPDQAGLAQAFREAAQSRYRWFEVRFHHDPLYFRRAFEVQLTIETTDSPSATVKFLPNPWIDAPPGEELPDDGLGPAPLTRTLGIVLPILGAVISLSYLPAAIFNGRRAVFGLVPRRKKR